MKSKKNYLLLLGYILISVLYIVPSVLFFLKYQSISPLWEVVYDDHLFIDTDEHESLQALLLLGLVLSLSVFYLAILKKHKELFPKAANALVFILIIQMIFALGVSINSSDVFCYWGTGRLYEGYGQNPYYVTVDEHAKTLRESGYDETFNGDSVFQRGLENFWADTRVSYGPIHVFVSAFITRLSNGNIDLAYIFSKIMVIMVNMMICFILYKLFDNNFFYALLYGLSPFFLIATTVNIHNDALFILFVLLAIYSIVKCKRIILGLLFLAISVNIKFISLVFFPFLVLYVCKEKRLTERIVFFIFLSLIFFELVFIPWIPFLQDIHVFDCILDQVGRTANSIYGMLPDDDMYDIVLRITSSIFIVVYIIQCFRMLIKKDFDLNKNMLILFYLVLFYLCFATTNLQYWYFIWLIPFLYFLSKKEMVMIVALQLASLLSHVLFICSDDVDVKMLTMFYGIILIYIFYKPFIHLIKLFKNNKTIQEKTSS